MTHAGNMVSHKFESAQTLSEEEIAYGYTSTGFYFYDETEAHVIGPYETFELAEKARSEYRP